MAYDIIFKAKQFVITEMSYGYNDKAVYDVDGYYELLPDHQFVRRPGHTWPQELWVEWLMCRLEQRYGPFETDCHRSAE
jgi:hypothetical protein